MRSFGEREMLCSILWRLVGLDFYIGTILYVVIENNLYSSDLAVYDAKGSHD